MWNSLELFGTLCIDQRRLSFPISSHALIHTRDDELPVGRPRSLVARGTSAIRASQANSGEGGRAAEPFNCRTRLIFNRSALGSKIASLSQARIKNEERHEIRIPFL